MPDNRPKIVETFTRKSNSFWPWVLYESNVERGGRAIGCVALRGPRLKRVFGCVPEQIKVGILMVEGAKDIYGD